MSRSPLTAMSNTTNKQQQSISSFFKPKPAAASSPIDRSTARLTSREKEHKSSPIQNGSLKGRPSEKEATEKSLLSLDKYSLNQSSVSEEANDAQPPASKRRKIAISESEDSDDGSPVRPRARAPAVAPASTGKTGRGSASKYFFNDTLEGSTNEADDDGDETEEVRLNKERLHRQFVKKLGGKSELLRRRTSQAQDEEEAEDDEDDDAEGAESIRPGKPGGKAGRQTSSKQTPMEKQYLDIKRKHLDTVIFLEVGYKFKLLGEDARIAARELGIVCIPGKLRYDEHSSEAHYGRFASASIPTHRLPVHVKRLVAAGHKVGVIRQLETAALKAAGTNRNTVFRRELTNVYTKATFVDDADFQDSADATEVNGPSQGGYLLAVTEAKTSGWGHDERVHVGLLAVQPATGDVIFDDFEDGFMRNELETRLLHISPSELLIIGELSNASERLLRHHGSGSADQIRIERVKKSRTAAAEAYTRVSDFYTRRFDDLGENAEQRMSMLDRVQKMTELVTICLSVMIDHLKEFKLDHVLSLTQYFASFGSRAHMLLNSNALTSLEVYRNQTDGTEKGSLFWFMNHCRTPFGQRLLRNWVGRPLVNQKMLEARIAAVNELLQSINTDKMQNVLDNIHVDLERSLVRIYYKRASRSELHNFLKVIQKVGLEYAHVHERKATGYSSTLVSDAVAQLSIVLKDATPFLDKMNPEAAAVNDKYTFLRPEHETEAIRTHKAGIKDVEEDLMEYRQVAAAKLGKRSVEYVTVAGIEYLIEVDNTQIKSVPGSYIKMSGTKKVSRFHAPEVVRMVKERDQHKESLAAACDAAFSDMLTEVGERFSSFKSCIQALSTLDCLLSLVTLAQQPGYVEPIFKDGTQIRISGGRHPMVEQTLLDTYVPNGIELVAGETTSLLVTGPNMGGKSSYVRQVALTCIMAQIGSYVPAESAEVGMLDSIFTRMGAFDNLMAGESTFMVELNETAEILRKATPRSLVILDELGRGTSTHDGVAIAHAVLDYIVRDVHSVNLFITHYQHLTSVPRTFDGEVAKNMHMRFHEDKDAEGNEIITFLYEVGEGVAHRSYGLNVARLAQLPNSLLELAKAKSYELEQRTRRQRFSNVFQHMAKLTANDNAVDFDMIIREIEQL